MEFTEIPLIHDFGKSVPLTSENKWEDIRHFFDSLSKLTREIHNTYLEELSTRVLNEYVALEDDPTTHGVVDWKDYQRLITVIESV